MDISAILSHVDHTLLKPEATWDQIKTLCDEAMEYGCATVCIPPAWVKPAADYVQGYLKICTVIGFPNGYNTTAAKLFETKDAVENGASEIDLVINNGMVRDRKWSDLTQEVKGVKAGSRVVIEDGTVTLDVSDDGLHSNGDLTISGGSAAPARTAHTG